MKSQFSVSWLSSKQPRKQRKYRYNAPLHLRQKLLSVHLDKGLRNLYKKRAVPIRTGDEVVVTTGSFGKERGKVTNVDIKKLKVYVDGMKRKKVSGQEMDIAFDPSNIMITKLNADDKKRQKFLSRKGKKIEVIETKKTEKSPPNKNEKKDGK